MAADSMNNWYSDDASDSQSCDFPDSDDDNSQPTNLARRSQLRPAGTGLQFVPYADCRPAQSYNKQPLNNICYDVQWKLSVNNRRRSGESKPSIALSPQEYWKYILKSKLQAAVARAKHPLAPSDTQISLSVNDRNTSVVEESFPKLDAAWSFATKYLQEWSHFLSDGKKLKVEIIFNYIEDKDKTASAARGATAVQSAEVAARVEGERAVLGRPESWRQVIALFRCPGPPCNKGPYCWLEGQKHYPLLTHQLKILVDEVQKGHSMQTHNDIPDRIRQQLYAEEQQQGERARKRKLRDSGSCLTGPPAIHIYNTPGDIDTARAGYGGPSIPKLVFPTSPTFDMQGSREDAVRAYVAWQHSKVSTKELKHSYNLVQDLTLDHGLSLDIIHRNRERYFELYIEHGVKEGVAWHFVCNIGLFLAEPNTE